MENIPIKNLTTKEIHRLTKEYLSDIKGIKGIKYKNNTQDKHFPSIDITILLPNQDVYISIYYREENTIHIEIYDKRYAPPHDDFNKPIEAINNFKWLKDFILSII